MHLGLLDSNEAHNEANSLIRVCLLRYPKKLPTLKQKQVYRTIHYMEISLFIFHVNACELEGKPNRKQMLSTDFFKNLI